MDHDVEGCVAVDAYEEDGDRECHVFVTADDLEEGLWLFTLLGVSVGGVGFEQGL